MPKLFPKPTQFGLKHLLVALAAVSVWAAVMRRPQLRGYGDVATLMALCYSSGPIIRFVGSWVSRFVERGYPAALSGVVAALAGCVGSLTYGTLLIDAYRNVDTKDIDLLVLVGGMFTVLILWAVGWVVVIALFALAVTDLFRRSLRSIPLVLASNIFCAVVGSVLFGAFQLLISVAQDDFNPKDLPLGVMTVLGGVVGFCFGSCGLHVHLDTAEEARIRANPELLQDGRLFEP